MITAPTSTSERIENLDTGGVGTPAVVVDRLARTIPFGPAEWAWRSLTYPEIQPNRRTTATTPT